MLGGRLYRGYMVLGVGDKFLRGFDRRVGGFFQQEKTIKER